MTLKDAVLKSLEDINNSTDSLVVTKHIKEKQYYDFGSAKTPSATIAAVLGDFIRNEDTRVSRFKKVGRTYSYYLTKNEKNISIDDLNGIDDLNVSAEIGIGKAVKSDKPKTFNERDLHMLLSTYLKSTDTYSKTIFHEQSNGVDDNQTWTHPDMVGVKFLSLRNEACQNFIKSINRVDTFKLSSYELKKGINCDSDLKKAFFQAVSNSSWSNYGYLVVFEFDVRLTEEMGRLNQSFGIGIIKLNANPFQSKILFPAKLRGLDFKMIDKLCEMNKKIAGFAGFIEQTEKYISAPNTYTDALKQRFEDSCDKFFKIDEDVVKYCREKHIPIDPESDSIE